MVNLVFLHVLVSEMSRLSQLTGNCGRVIARFFERHFPRDRFTLLCELPEGAHLQAVFLARLHGALASVESLLRESGNPVRIDREPLVPGQTFTLVRITLENLLPESLAERRQLLAQLQAAFVLLVSVAELTETQLLREWNRRLEENDPERAQTVVIEHLSHVDEVLRGEDQNLCHLPFFLIWLLEDNLPDARGQMFARLLANS
jgi:hypothetical protein